MERERGGRTTAAGRAAGRAYPLRRRAEDAPDPRTLKKTSPKKSTRTAQRVDRSAGRLPAGKDLKTTSQAASVRRKRNPQAATAARRGSTKPVTKRSLKGAGPSSVSGSTRGGRR